MTTLEGSQREPSSTQQHSVQIGRIILHPGPFPAFLRVPPGMFSCDDVFPDLQCTFAPQFGLKRLQ